MSKKGSKKDPKVTGHNGACFRIEPKGEKVQTSRRPVRNEVTESLTNEEMASIVEQYGDEMLRVAYLYLGQREQAEDAVQDSFIKIYRAAEKTRICKTFVMRVLTNTCKDYLKSGWSRNVNLLEDLPEDTSGSDAYPESGALREAVFVLPIKYREVVLLHYYEDMSVGEIAKVLGVPQPTVSTRLKRACKQLEKRLEGISREDY